MKKGKPRKRKPNKGASASVVLGEDGIAHLYLNYAKPLMRDGTPKAADSTAICKTCKHGYAHLVGSGREICDECRLENAAEWGMHVQDTCGVNLGWRRSDVLNHPHKVSRVDLPGTIVIKQAIPGPSSAPKPKRLMVSTPRIPDPGLERSWEQFKATGNAPSIEIGRGPGRDYRDVLQRAVWEKEYLNKCGIQPDSTPPPKWTEGLELGVDPQGDMFFSVRINCLAEMAREFGIPKSVLDETPPASRELP